MAEEDQDCVARCLRGEETAFAELLGRYRDRVFTFLLRIAADASDAEDLCQDTFIKAFRNLSSYDTTRPLISWLFRIAHNTAVDFLRAREPQALSWDDADEPVEPLSRVTDRLAQEVVHKELVERALGSLPALYREILVLRHQEELDYSEIAAVLQIPDGTVKNRLFRAREMLRRKLEGQA